MTTTYDLDPIAALDREDVEAAIRQLRAPAARKPDALRPVTPDQAALARVADALAAHLAACHD